MARSPGPLAEARGALRLTLRARRRALDAATRSAHAESLAGRLAASHLFRNCRTIAVYLASDGEVDLQPLIKRAWAHRKQVSLPVLHGRRLHFLPYAPATPLAANRYGIPEPDLSARHRVALVGLDLVIVPLVGFDGAGNRLGMGAGYYDRSFAFLSRRRYWRRPLLVGAAFELQRCEALPARPWDVPLDAVVTERSLCVFRRQRAGG